MLSYAFQVLNEQGYKSIATEQFDNVGDLCAAILAKGVSRQLKQGLGREYIEHTEQLSALRGRIEITESVKIRSILKRQMVCTYDEFSTNSYFNRIIKTTMELLIRSDISKVRKKELRKLLVFFGDVDTLNPRLINWNQQYNRNNQTYRMLISICYLVIKGLLQTNSDGFVKLMDFIDEQRMCRLYEKFILEYYKQHHPELDPKSAQVKWNLTEQPDETMIQFLPKMQTDITLQKGDKTLIIDAKYYGKSMAQSYSKETLRSAHLYQIFAYVKNMDTANTGNVSGLLLYAKTEDEMFPEGEPFVIGGNSIGARTLDLNVSFDTLRIQLDKIAEECFN